MKIGILGAGQLGKMLAEACIKLGHTPKIYSPKPGPACDVVPDAVIAGWDDATALSKFSNDCDILTYELEQLPLRVFDHIEENKVRPSKEALRITQNRFLEKSFCKDLGLGVTNFAKLETLSDLNHIVFNFEFPLLLKSNEGGYDGKGQRLVKNAEELQSVFEDWQQPCIVEKLVNWITEVSVIATRSESGQVAFSSATQNHHAGGILRWSVAPATLPESDEQSLHQAVKKVLDKFSYVGTLGVEFFQTETGYLINELAPRVHNSGHWTIEGASTSQFENHIRALTGMELQTMAAEQPVVMVNMIGDLELKSLAENFAQAVVHDYKKEPRVGRKLGHITFTFENQTSAQDFVKKNFFH